MRLRVTVARDDTHREYRLSKASPKKNVARGYSGQQVELQVRSKDGVAKEKDTGLDMFIEGVLRMNRFTSAVRG